MCYRRRPPYFRAGRICTPRAMSASRTVLKELSSWTAMVRRELPSAYSLAAWLIWSGVSGWRRIVTPCSASSFKMLALEMS